MFLNRTSELNDLTKIILEKKASLINIYGRRRIGKTYFLKEFINALKNQINIVYYVCYQGNSELQLNHLYQIILEEFPEETALTSLKPPSWIDLFNFLFELKNPLVLILDEFPYVVETDRSIPSIIQNSWDKFHKTSRLQLILCGSSVSIMKELMGAKQPLNGRFTNVLSFRPFNFLNTRLFIRNPLS